MWSVPRLYKEKLRLLESLETSVRRVGGQIEMSKKYKYCNTGHRKILVTSEDVHRMRYYLVINGRS
jgi:hypothetical protein